MIRDGITLMILGGICKIDFMIVVATNGLEPSTTTMSRWCSTN